MNLFLKKNNYPYNFHQHRVSEKSGILIHMQYELLIHSGLLIPLLENIWDKSPTDNLYNLI